MLVWPAELPQHPLQEGFLKTFGDGRLRTSMENGPPKVRRRFSSAVRPISATFRMSLDQHARLERFWYEDTIGGSLPFLIPDPVYDGSILIASDGSPITCPDGNSMLVDGNVVPETLGGVITLTAWWLVLFGEQPPSAPTRNRGLSWQVSITLSVMP